jgi:hypothetical protein
MSPDFTEANGWCPFAVYHLSPNYWVGHYGNVLAVVMHIAAGGYQPSIDHLCDPNTGVSAHFIVSKQGEITQMVSIYNSARANGLKWEGGRWKNARGKFVSPPWVNIIPQVNPNLYTVSIEHEGFPEDPRTPQMGDADVRLLRWIAGRLHLVYQPDRSLIGHRDIDPVDKGFCPGPQMDFAQLATAANAPDIPFPPISGDSPLLGPPTGPQDKAVAYIKAHLKQGSEYKNDVEIIVGYYWKYALQVGMDPFLGVAQCAHETDSLSSAWAARPHRNPAGLGVHEEGGLSFATWDDAVQAHLGQLLAFALTDAQANANQRAMMLRNPRYPLIPAGFRGAAGRWKDLGGRWTQNPDYAAGVIRRAQEMLAWV